MMSPNESRGSQALLVTSLFTGFAILLVSLRLYTRFFIVKYAGVEDYFIAAAMACSIGLTACVGMQVRYGMGKHIWEINPEDTPKSLKAFWASLIVYYLSLGLTKSSILLQYRRVFTTKKFQIACWTTLAIVVIYTAWTLMGSIFACVPVRAFWTMERATCINQHAMWFANAAINIVTDFLIIILPMPVIRNLQLARRQKAALAGVFAVGGTVCIISIIRLHSLVAISNSKDPTYDNPPAATWSAVETNIGIICSCLPCLRPLVSRYFPSKASVQYRQSASNSRPRPDDSVYGKQSSQHSSSLDLVETPTSHKPSLPDFRMDRIKVVKEVHVQVADDDHHGSDSRLADDDFLRKNVFGKEEV